MLPWLLLVLAVAASRAELIKIPAKPIYEQFSAREARALMKALKKALLEKPARAELREHKPKRETQAERKAALGPLLDRLTLSVRRKHRMKASFWSAVEAAEAFLRKEHDRDLEVALHDIYQTVLGEPGPTFVGRVQELSELAADFFGMDRDLQRDSLATAAALRKKLQKKGAAQRAADAQRYEEIMQGFIERGPTHFETLGAKLSSLFAGSQEEVNKATLVLNALRDFLSDNEMARLIARLWDDASHDRHSPVEL
eukprot:TRINITY_DN109355_c0_g1_i1.p1 TRINITY_DN109355_c0_g1~~TRINITY_DN109355_c0_g1_i1.p1  ORF type:complete len:256 (+),score=67.17 TRINITY_DN109355_c0_g1_i1:217-984(+)